MDERRDSLICSHSKVLVKRCQKQTDPIWKLPLVRDWGKFHISACECLKETERGFDGGEELREKGDSTSTERTGCYGEIENVP